MCLSLPRFILSFSNAPKFQDLRKLAFEAPLVGAHRRAPSPYVEFLRKSWFNRADIPDIGESIE
jgi:hypothetical protein